MRYVGLCFLLGLLAGCGTMPIQDILNAREVTSCIWVQGSAPPYAAMRSVTATGGATLQDCEKFK